MPTGQKPICQLCGDLVAPPYHVCETFEFKMWLRDLARHTETYRMSPQCVRDRFHVE